MRFLFTLAKQYPWQSLLMVTALLVAGVLEGVGLSILLPLLNIAFKNQSGVGETFADHAATESSRLEHWLTHTFSALGIPLTVEALLLLIIVAMLLKSGMILMANKKVGYTVAQVATDLRLALLRALLVTRWEYYLSQPVGSLANAMATEAKRASNAYLQGIMMTAEFFQAFVYAILAFLISWEATAAALAVGMIILFLLKRLIRKSRRAGARQTQLLKSMLSLMTDTLQSIKPLKAMGRESVSDFLLGKKTNQLNKALQKIVLSKEVLRAFQEPLVTVFLAIGLYVILVHWRLPLTTVIVLVFLLTKLIKQLNKIQERYQEMVVFESAYWSMQTTIKKAQSMQEEATGILVPSLKRAIRLDEIGFAYDGRWVTRHARLEFPAGKITVMVGPSGSGKTTILDLVMGLLRPQEGEIWVDELPLAQVDLKTWRRMIGYVPQETSLLHDTVFTNVTLGESGLKEADAVDALKAAGAWEFVKSMPQGLHSMVGERGGMVSGGQRQRIAIARALVHRPALLILDEATSALDYESEKAICATLQELRGKLTILAVSHRPGMVTIADHAYRMQDGHVLPAKETDFAVG